MQLSFLPLLNWCYMRCTLFCIFPGHLVENNAIRKKPHINRKCVFKQQRWSLQNGSFTMTRIFLKVISINLIWHQTYGSSWTLTFEYLCYLFIYLFMFDFCEKVDLIWNIEEEAKTVFWKSSTWMLHKSYLDSPLEVTFSWKQIWCQCLE